MKRKRNSKKKNPKIKPSNQTERESGRVGVGLRGLGKKF